MALCVMVPGDIRSLANDFIGSIRMATKRSNEQARLVHRSRKRRWRIVVVPRHDSRELHLPLIAFRSWSTSFTHIVSATCHHPLPGNRSAVRFPVLFRRVQIPHSQTPQSRRPQPWRRQLPWPTRLRNTSPPSPPPRRAVFRTLEVLT
jgi:hypothetical protein